MKTAKEVEPCIHGDLDCFDCKEAKTNADYMESLVKLRDELVKALEGMMEWARRVNTTNPGPEIYNALGALAKAQEVKP